MVLVVQAVQQELEERLMSLREDMQASQQHIAQQFAQHQVHLIDADSTDACQAL